MTSLRLLLLDGNSLNGSLPTNWSFLTQLNTPHTIGIVKRFFQRVMSVRSRADVCQNGVINEEPEELKSCPHLGSIARSRYRCMEPSLLGRVTGKVLLLKQEDEVDGDAATERGRLVAPRMYDHAEIYGGRGGGGDMFASLPMPRST